ncbi:sco-spondin-like [Plakobranchus ocellatus]|uniref:Sco-spondin-like n=1 Tax=Plakobranchus ocellatus TaxID=259542 RepID=A0AAV3ZPJ6_9GAST|nr:sco-spondin-like [Plakobranchus ocellatus]
MTMSTQCPMLILLVTLCSSQWTRSTSGQQIFDDWDHPEEQGTPDTGLNLTVTFMSEREFNVTTRTSNLYNLEANSTEQTEQVTGAPTAPVRGQVLGVGDYQHSDQVFLWTSHQELYTSAGKGLMGHVFLTLERKRTTFQCAFECLKHARCLSFNFRSTSDFCELSDASHVESPESIEDVKGCEYHARSAYSVDQRALGPCAGEPCSGHGRCLETRSVSGQPAGLCLCDHGWTGTDCNHTGKIFADSKYFNYIFWADAGPQWGEWARWSACSVTCHRGWRMRSRNCEDSTNGKTLSAGQCYGTSQEYGVCWESWGAWGECSSENTCGSGVKVRQRACSNGGTVGVDRYCLGLANQSTPCSGVSCNGPMKLVGGFVPGEGRLEIYDDVHQQWTLVCADQMTTAMAAMVCRQLGWPGGHAAITDGRFGSGSGQFGLTSVMCQGSEWTIAECEHNKWTTTGICHGGATLAAGVQCNVNGVWSLWSAWSECSVTCENGTRTRTRQCDHPPRLHGGRDCVGETVQTKNCSLPMCPVDGVWTAWGPWHACSVTCDNGTQVRTRDCHGPFYDGQDCEGPANDTRDCMDRHCPVNGAWEEWSVWSECSLTCANGTRTRYRNCTGPFYEGLPCDGAAQDEERCNTHECPVDGYWLPWQQWSECTASCGGGSRVRVKDCQQPLYGGVACEGDYQQREDCNQHHCPIDGEWSSWAEWSECTVTCGNGTQDRNRTCVGPFHLGAPCMGEDYQIQWTESGCPGVSGVCVAKLAVTAVRPGLVPVTGRSMEEPTVQDLAWRRETVTHTRVLVSGIRPPSLIIWVG